MRKWIMIFCLPLLAIIANASPSPANIIENIHIDQFGYRCSDQKIAVISSAQTGYYGSSYTSGIAAGQYEVRRWTDDVPVMSRTLSVWAAGATQAQSGDKAWWFDFSSLSTPGDYYIYDGSTGKASYEFKVDNQVYKEVLKQAMRTYFYQRCGMAKMGPYAGTGWTDAACHVGNRQDKDCRLYNNNSASTYRRLCRSCNGQGNGRIYEQRHTGAGHHPDQRPVGPHGVRRICYNSYTISLFNMAAALYYLCLRDNSHPVLTSKLIKW